MLLFLRSIFIFTTTISDFYNSQFKLILVENLCPDERLLFNELNTHGSYFDVINYSKCLCLLFSIYKIHKY